MKGYNKLGWSNRKHECKKFNFCVNTVTMRGLHNMLWENIWINSRQFMGIMKQRSLCI